MHHTARVVFVGSFTPRQCGIATFTRDLVDGYDAYAGTRSDVVAIDDRLGFSYAYESRVVARLKEDELPSYREAAAIINALPASVVNVQHEYGLFGGEGGAWVGEFLSAIRKPVVLTMHTVLANPSAEHIDLARTLMRYAAEVVVLSQTARRLLVERYGTRIEDISVVHHGVPDVAFEGSTSAKASLAWVGGRSSRRSGCLAAVRVWSTRSQRSMRSRSTIPTFSIFSWEPRTRTCVPPKENAIATHCASASQRLGSRRTLPWSTGTSRWRNS